VYGASYPPFGYDWLKPNPNTVLSDPDFLQYNPEFKLLSATAGSGYNGGLLVEEPTSDTAYELWRWILADPAARAWLASKPDPWGMTVNPYYSTDPNVNNTGAAFGAPIPESYPKSDPYCFQDANLHVAGTTPPQLAPPLCPADYFPYAASMQNAASETRSTNIGAKRLWNGVSFGSSGPQGTGQSLVMSITDSASAAQFGLQTASLSAAGDDRPQPTFVAPTSSAFAAGEAAMGSMTEVRQPNASTAGVYPLTLLSYAVAAPTSMTPADRSYFAQLLDYAAGPGQVPGDLFGQLPPGYAPLPADLRAQTLKAASELLHYSGPANLPGSASTVGSAGPGPPAAAGSSSNQPGGGSSAGTPSSTATTASARRVGAGAVPLSVSSRELAKSSSPAGRTPGIWGSGWRFLLLGCLALGVACAFSARWLQVWRRHRMYKTGGATRG
jgi:hypothetical protein